MTDGVASKGLDKTNAPRQCRTEFLDVSVSYEIHIAHTCYAVDLYVVQSSKKVNRKRIVDNSVKSKTNSFCEFQPYSVDFIFLCFGTMGFIVEL